MSSATTVRCPSQRPNRRASWRQRQQRSRPRTPGAEAPAAPAVTTVAIDIDSIPSGAVVMLDDVRAGTTPFTTSLARGGSSELRLVLDGYEPLVQPVAFDRDERLVLALKKKLSPNPTPGPARPPHARPTKQPDPPKPPPAVEGDGFHRFD